MGWWRIGADTLANSRFTVSPLAETTACLKVLHRGTAAHPGERSWLDAHGAAYRARLAADPVSALLVHAALGRFWNADFLTPAPTGGDTSAFAEEVDRVRGADPDTARADLLLSLDGPLPAALDRSDLPERAAALLEWVWVNTVEPTWSTRRRIAEADIVARTDRLTRGGWSAVLGDMRPGMEWMGEGRLRLNGRDLPPREISGALLMFVPVTASQGWVAWDEGADPRRYAITYPCSGALTGGAPTPVPEALGRLVGAARARVLVLLGTPKSTSQLVALTGQGLGSVGRHLRVLLDARLAERRRAGRSVLYQRTRAGDALVAAQRGGGTEPPGR